MCTPAGRKADVGPLSMTLNGTIDAAVNGGTQKYIEAFLAPSYLKEHPEHKEQQDALKRGLKEQLDLLKLGLEAFNQRGDSDLRGLYQHLKNNYSEMKESTFTAINLAV